MIVAVIRDKKSGNHKVLARFTDNEIDAATELLKDFIRHNKKVSGAINIVFPDGERKLLKRVKRSWTGRVVVS